MYQGYNFFNVETAGFRYRYFSNKGGTLYKKARSFRNRDLNHRNLCITWFDYDWRVERAGLSVPYSFYGWKNETDTYYSQGMFMVNGSCY